MRHLRGGDPGRPLGESEADIDDHTFGRCQSYFWRMRVPDRGEKIYQMPSEGRLRSEERKFRVFGDNIFSDLCNGLPAVYFLGAWPREKHEVSCVAFGKELADEKQG